MTGNQRLGLALAVFYSLSIAAVRADDPPNRDSILHWNSVALAAVVADHSGTFGPAQQGGPTRTSRALAIVHAAMFDALNSITPTAKPYLAQVKGNGASIDAAVASAARESLNMLYSAQSAEIDRQFTQFLKPIHNGSAKDKGIQIGTQIAQKILNARRYDGSSRIVTYTPTGDLGEHDVDPLNPFQGFLTPGWGDVTTFALRPRFHYASPPPPVLDSSEYAIAYEDVMIHGGDGDSTPTIRSPEQTEIGIYWGYDGAPGIGVPPRMYNQIARVIAGNQHNTEAQNARLFALINLAMADAGIICWDTKYEFRFWRPILGVRDGDIDGNDQTLGDPAWTPLGAQASNQGGNDFTPPFPAYSSGHATFGAATFGILARFYRSDAIPFTFVSDELNGVTTDSQGNTRPLRPRSFTSLSAASTENARSRIYLGIHWQFDADEGVHCGEAIAQEVFANVLRPLKP